MIKRYFQLIVILIIQIVSISSIPDAEIQLEVEGKGFHRMLIYTVKLPNLVDYNCHVSIYLELPSGLYVNIDELEDLRRLGSITACSVGETNVELFMEKAISQNVTICALLSDASCVLKLPIHQRYQYAKEGGDYNVVILPNPKLLVGCKNRVKQYRVSKIDLCSPCFDMALKWREIPYVMENQNYIWSVPIGDSSLLMPVTIVTLLTTFLGAVFILRAIFNSTTDDHLKEG